MLAHFIRPPIVLVASTGVLLPTCPLFYIDANLAVVPSVLLLLFLILLLLPSIENPTANELFPTTLH